MSCRLMEQQTIAGGTTSASFAWLNATSKLEDEYHRLNVAGMKGHRKWADRWGSDATGHRHTGCLIWAGTETATSLDDLEQTFERLRELDYPCQRLDGYELADLEPRIAFAHGAQELLMSRDGWLDAPHLARHLAREIVRRGGVIHHGEQVTGFLGTAPVLDGVESESGLIRADNIVIAAGTCSGDLAARALGSQRASQLVGSEPGLLVDIAGAGAWLNHVVCFPEGGDGLHMRPDVDAGLQMGSDAADAMLADESQALRHLAAKAQHWFADVESGEVMARMTSRIGHRSMPADGHPIVGRLPGCDNLFIAVTHSGITLAPVIGTLIADDVTGMSASPRLRNFRPDRFIWT